MLSPNESKDPARVELHELHKKAIRAGSPGGASEFDELLERMIIGALRKIETGFAELQGATRVVRTSALRPAARLEKVEKPKVVDKDASAHDLIRASFAEPIEVVSGARRR